jgi:hypothetical protein
MELLLQNIGLIIGLWALVYTSDYLLTITSARLYEAGAKKHVLLAGGVELTPAFKKDVARMRWVSPRFLLALALMSALLGILWYLSIYLGYAPELFEFILGAMLLLEGAIHIRHLRNLFQFCYLKNSRGVEGQIRYASWLSYRMSKVELLGFALLYLAVYFLFRRPFFLGGAVTATLTAVYHWLLSQRAARMVIQPFASSESLAEVEATGETEREVPR